MHSRGLRRVYRADGSSGLGLGLFIAKTLLERTGARLAFQNRPAPDHGARVRVIWDRSEFERAQKSFQLESGGPAP
jgi:signal transduction histidine kinase